MVNYQNGKIYKIESIEGKCMYIGSTCQLLCQRMAKHRYRHKTDKAISSTEVLKYNDAKIYLLLKYPCNSKEELESKEGEYIKKYKCVNKQEGRRTHRQYYKDNKKILNEKQKTRYTCICGSITSISNKSQHEKTKKHITYINNNELQKL